MIETIPGEVFAAVAKEVFGGDAEVESVEEIVALVEDGLVRRAAYTRNLTCIVKLAASPRRYVFRFSRGEGDRYEEEARSYRLLAERAGAPVPTLYRVDRTRTVAPVPYMVMDYMPGHDWRYLAHPASPETTPEEKERIRREVGRFHARVHGIVRPAERPDSEALHVLYMLERLEAAVLAGHLEVDPEKIERCKAAAAADPALRGDTQSLCLADTEIFFARRDGGWEMSFVCDPEWVEYRDPYSDLAFLLVGSTPIWELNEPVRVDPDEARRSALFQGYETLRPVDYGKLAAVPAYYQLGLWANIATEDSPPEKKEWIRAAKGGLIRALVEIVAARA